VPAQVGGVYTEVLGLPAAKAQVGGVYTEVLAQPEGRAQVEATWLEALVAGGGTAQVEASWLEALVRGVGVTQVEATWVEALVVPSYERAGVTIASTASIPTMTPTWAAVPGATVRVAAAVGDWVEVGFQCTWDPGAGVFCYGDVAVVNALGTVAHWVSTATTSHTGGIFGLFQATGAGAYMPADGSSVYQVQAGDVAVDGTVTFAAYAKTLNGNRTINAAQNVMIWAAPCPNTPATGGATGAVPTSWALLTGSVTVAAVAGDVLSVTSNVLVNGIAGGVYAFDAVTVVAGAAVNWVSTGGPSHAGGVGGWRCVFGDYEPVGGLGVLYTVQAADVVGGTVTVSMAGRAISGTPPTSDAGSTFTVRKV
jgi:hypothetical protein